MRVVVDDARREREPVRVDDLPRRAAFGADGADAPILYREAGAIRRCAEAVDDQRVADYEVMHAGMLPKLACS